MYSCIGFEQTVIIHKNFNFIPERDGVNNDVVHEVIGNESVEEETYQVLHKIGVDRPSTHELRYGNK